jgi:hypothetical protein
MSLGRLPVDRAPALCPVPSPPSAVGPGGDQSAPAPHHRGYPRPSGPRVDHRAQTDLGRYALAPDYPATSGAGPCQVRRGPRPVRRAACRRAGLCGGPSARDASTADLRRASTRDCSIPATPWGRNSAKSCVQNVAAQAGEDQLDLTGFVSTSKDETIGRILSSVAATRRRRGMV